MQRSAMLVQAHLAPVTSNEDVQDCMTSLLQHNKIRNATHNILAYRIYVKDRDAWLQVTLLHKIDVKSRTSGSLVVVAQ